MPHSPAASFRKLAISRTEPLNGPAPSKGSGSGLQGNPEAVGELYR